MIPGNQQTLWTWAEFTIVTNTFTLNSFDDKFALVSVQSEFKVDHEMVRMMGGTGDEVQMVATKGRDHGGCSQWLVH